MQIEQLDGGKTEIADAAFEELRTAFRGSLIVPGDAEFSEARKVWNGMIDRRPGLIAQCSGAADVIAAVNFARTHGLLVAVRGGGHSWPGHSVCDDGLMIDLSRMRGVRVDLATKTVRAHGGALWGDVDHESQAFGLATSGGVVSTTGIGGLTLGGGSQTWLIRRYGSTADNLVSADVVTAAGDLLRASETENADLFWAIRGGGGNFGVVTSFEYRLHPVGPLVLAGPTFFLWDRAKEITDFYLEYVQELPDELTTALYYWTAPPAPFLPSRSTDSQSSSSRRVMRGRPRPAKEWSRRYEHSSRRPTCLGLYLTRGCKRCSIRCFPRGSTPTRNPTTST